jgi:hypothetical protein
MANTFLVNIGVNASHNVYSSLRSDGSFSFLPIPEDIPAPAPMLRYSDIPALASQVPAAWRSRVTHADPDFYSKVVTYGDNCERIPRAFALRRAQSGDIIVFIARLINQDGQAGFYLVGRLEIAAILKGVNGDPGPGWWDSNAHVRRGRALGRWDAFSVFEGNANSGLLAQAVPFGRAQAEAVFGSAWDWSPSQTTLQVIGSHTRSVRRLEAKAAQTLAGLASGSLRASEVTALSTPPLA